MNSLSKFCDMLFVQLNTYITVSYPVHKLKRNCLIFSIQIESSRSISSCEEPDSAIPISNKFELARKGHKRAVSDTAVLLQKDLYQVVEPHELTQITEEDPKIPYQYPAPGMFFTRLYIK